MYITATNNDSKSVNELNTDHVGYGCNYDYLTDWFVYVLCNCTKYCCTDNTKILFTCIEHNSELCISQYLCNWLK